MADRVYKLGIWTLGLAAALTVGCTDDKQPGGELMLAFDSDMSIPKDVSGVRLEAQIGNSGELLDFALGPDQNHLPATFGLRSKDGTSKNIDIKLIAKKGDRARTVSASRTTVPSNRIALLRLPIEWLCTLRVNGAEDGSYDDDCMDDETCVAGRCQPASVTESDLPTYDPADVFGGGVGDGNSGTCFQTADAFEKAVVVTSDIDLEHCRVSLGTHPETANLALRVRRGDGICISDDLCLVTLNKSKVTGWYPVDADGNAASDGSYAALPPAVCDELTPTGAIISVYLGYSFPQKIPSIPVCAPWSSAGTPGQNNPKGGSTDPNVLCPAAGTGKAGADIVADPVVASYLDLSTTLRAQADALLAGAGSTCVAIATALDADDVWSPLGYDAEKPTRSSVQAACGTASQSVLQALAKVERVKLGIAPEHCAIDPQAQIDCEAGCAPDDGCPDTDRCNPSDESTNCKSTCEYGGVCEGALDNLTACNGKCDGVCKGTCEGGICTRLGASAQCEGFCDGACLGECAGDCTLDGDLSCGTGTTCRGGCSRPGPTLTCSTPLVACKAVGPTCSAICATGAAATSTCELGGGFAAKTELDAQDAKLEKVLVNEVLPKLVLLDDVRQRTVRITEQQSAIDSSKITSDAASGGDDQVSGCARAADSISVGALADFNMLTELMTGSIDPILAIDPLRPAVCLAAQQGDDCQQCIANNCCTTLVACQANEICLGDSSDPLSDAEVPCMLRCVSAGLEPGELPSNDVTLPCIAQCAKSSQGLAGETSGLLQCIASNVNVGCDVCYKTVSGTGGKGGMAGAGGDGSGDTAGTGGTGGGANASGGSGATGGKAGLGGEGGANTGGEASN